MKLRHEVGLSGTDTGLAAKQLPHLARLNDIIGFRWSDLEA